MQIAITAPGALWSPAKSHKMTENCVGSDTLFLLRLKSRDEHIICNSVNTDFSFIPRGGRHIVGYIP